MWLNEKKENLFFMKDQTISENTVLLKLLIWIVFFFAPFAIFSQHVKPVYIPRPIMYWQCEGCGGRNQELYDACQRCGRARFVYWNRGKN